MSNAMTDRRSLRHFDWMLLLSVLTLALMGIALVYSATSSPGSTHAGFHWRQLTWLGIGLVGVGVLILSLKR